MMMMMTMMTMIVLCVSGGSGGVRVGALQCSSKGEGKKKILKINQICFISCNRSREMYWFKQHLFLI